MTTGAPGRRGRVVRRLLLRGVLAVVATAVTACGLEPQPQPEPIPPDRLPDGLVQPAQPRVSPG